MYMENKLENQRDQEDFFISYSHEDWQQAKWISQQLENAGYSTILPGRDFLPGRNVPLEMNKVTQAKRTIAVLSPHYLTSKFTQAEWTTVFHQDPTGAQGLLLPIRVLPCDVHGMLAPLIYIDLVGLQDEKKACKILLAGVKQEPKQLKPVDFSPLLFSGRPSTTDIVQQTRFGAPFPEHWNVPRRHAPYFTGRDGQIEQIFQAFTRQDTAQIPLPQAITGLGGLGKTQVAAEYTYRYREKYPTAVLWVRADTKENLMADFQSLVHLLHLPGQENALETMRSWFTTQSDWLLIFDNADDLQIVDPFLPHTQRGHVLLTTRVRGASNIAQPFLLTPLDQNDGALCIMRRAGSIPFSGQLHEAPSSRRDAAIQISDLMEGLPLALEQAGAYIEDTGSTETRYLKIYKEYRADMLQRQFGALPNYPLPVATAWTFSKSVIQQKEPASFELLQLCAFLAPDVIPEEIFTQGAKALGPVLGPAVNSFSLDITTIILRRYSLLNREVKGEEDMPRFSIHRMMQEILQDEMNEATKQIWAERAVKAVSHALYSVDEHAIRSQVMHCISLIQQWNMTFPEAECIHQYAEEKYSYSTK
jgi:TIR domain/NB-ARC domain